MLLLDLHLPVLLLLLGPLALRVHLELLAPLVLRSRYPNRLIALAILRELVHEIRMRLEPLRPLGHRAPLEVRVVSL